MIGWHCGKRLIHLREDKTMFRKRCTVCGRVFQQGKRQPNPTS